MMNDKALHFLAGVVVGTLAMILFGSGAAIIAAMLAGAAKEIYDYVTGNGTADLGDFVATAMGGMLIEAIALIGAGW